MLKLMYITNQPDIASIAQACGVDRIFVDMEYIGKSERQGGMDTVQNHHTVDDVRNIRKAIDSSKLVVRVNPIFDGSKREIDDCIDSGADIIMLPMWRSAKEVATFLDLVGGRAKTMLLLETQEAVDCLDDVLELDGIDEIHIGLNDLHLSQNKRFLFELLSDGTVDEIVGRIKSKGIPFGFGGIGRIGEGTLPASLIACEHYRLGSSIVILSRSFCNTDKLTDTDRIKKTFLCGVKDLRDYEKKLSSETDEFFASAHNELCSCVQKIVEGM